MTGEQVLLLLLLLPGLGEWLDEDRLVWLVVEVVGELDLAERPSRVIERRCREDVLTRVICANQVADHTTIARLRARHQDALARTFTQVLALCARAGLVSVGVVAPDGTAMAANASLEANRRSPAIGEEVDQMLEEAARVDAAEDAEHGSTRGDELPPGLADRRSRLERLRRWREELEAEQAEVEAAHAAKLAWRAEWEAEHGRRLGGRKPFALDPTGCASARSTPPIRTRARSSARAKRRSRATTRKRSRPRDRSSWPPI
ncbi:MAG TPA: transposase [Solirubrobacter sp.]|nr:transposase [Solirubrobacter sp.]